MQKETLICYDNINASCLFCNTLKKKNSWFYIHLGLAFLSIIENENENYKRI